MQFEWDENKNRINKSKHGISFETAKRVWKDPHIWIYLDRVDDGEHRFHAVGIIGALTLLTVIHTHRDDAGIEVIRIIGARRATRASRAGAS